MNDELLDSIAPFVLLRLYLGVWREGKESLKKEKKEGKKWKELRAFQRERALKRLVLFIIQNLSNLEDKKIVLENGFRGFG